MKIAAILFAASFVVLGCGGGSGDKLTGGTPTTGAGGPSNLQLAATKADITCNTAATNFIFYAKSESLFYLCDGTELSSIDLKGKDGAAGTDGAAGATGAAGLTIAQMYHLTSAISDICTRYTNITCSFRGGTLIKYVGNLKYIEGGIVNYEEYVQANGTDLDTDTVVADSFTYTTSGLAYSKLTEIARTGSDTNRQLWIAYDNSTDSSELWYDLDNDGVLETTDEKIETLARSLVGL